jgi:HEPN domain-containing protein
MAKRTYDWLKQAERDLKHARNSLKLKDYEWACFAAQQSAEKGLKALYEFLGGEGWGHSVTKLLVLPGILW